MAVCFWQYLIANIGFEKLDNHESLIALINVKYYTPTWNIVFKFT